MLVLNKFQNMFPLVFLIASVYPYLNNIIIGAAATSPTHTHTHTLFFTCHVLVAYINVEEYNISIRSISAYFQSGFSTLQCILL